MQRPLADFHLAIVMDGVDSWRRQDPAGLVVPCSRAHDALDGTLAVAVQAGVGQLTFIVPANAPARGLRDAPDWPLQFNWPTLSARAGYRPVSFRLVGDQTHEPLQRG